MTDIPIVCDLTAIAAPEREAHEELAKELVRNADKTEELDSGVRFTWSIDRLHDVATYIKNERLCCPFWDFTVRVKPGEALVSLDLVGPEGVKEELQPLIAELQA